MSLTFLGWLLVISSLAITALLIVQLRTRGSQLPLDHKDGVARHREARPRPEAGHLLRRAAGTLGVPAAAFFCVAGVGAATVYLGDASGEGGSANAISRPQPHSGPDGELLAGLEDYTRSAATEKVLPDVNTMIERLAARLKTTPEDTKGWRMLGWSYFHMERYDEAAAAYAKAVALDPGSADLKLSYEEARAKAAGSQKVAAASPDATEAAGKGAERHGAAETVTPEAMPPGERDARIRSMVDGLADRLERSPRDVEGWTRLMRSRVVLGERQVAATAFRKALDVFKDDSAASTRITEAAIELGLKAE